MTLTARQQALWTRIQALKAQGAGPNNEHLQELVREMAYDDSIIQELVEAAFRWDEYHSHKRVVFAPTSNEEVES